VSGGVWFAWCGCLAVVFVFVVCLLACGCVPRSCCLHWLVACTWLWRANDRQTQTNKLFGTIFNAKKNDRVLLLSILLHQKTARQKKYHLMRTGVSPFVEMEYLFRTFVFPPPPPRQPPPPPARHKTLTTNVQAQAKHPTANPGQAKQSNRRPQKAIGSIHKQELFHIDSSEATSLLLANQSNSIQSAA
jgi:hypothetical protein